MKFQYRCEVVIDRGRYIGADPGHACLNSAKWEYLLMDPVYYLICDECKEMLEKEPHRVTWPPFLQEKGHR